MKVEYRTTIPDDVKKFINEVLNRYDTRELETIIFRKSKGKIARGTCYYPISTRKANKLNAKNYRKKHWEPRKYYYIDNRIPDEPKDQIWRYVKKWGPDEHFEKDGQEYIKHTVDEAEYANVTKRNDHIVILFGHELYHFLRKTKQIEGRNSQNQANGFGIAILKEYTGRIK